MALEPQRGTGSCRVPAERLRFEQVDATVLCVRLEVSCLSSTDGARAGPRRIRAAMRGLAVAVGLGVGLPAVANAGCNLIPVAALELPAAYIGPTQNGVVGTAATDPVGYLDRAVAGPGQTVTVRADLACQPAEPGFALPSDPN